MAATRTIPSPVPRTAPASVEEEERQVPDDTAAAEGQPSDIEPVGETASDGESAADDADSTDEVSTEPGERTRGRKRPWIVLGALVLLLATTITSGLFWLSGKSAQADRAAALVAAESATTALTSINFDTADQDIQRVIQAGTGEFGGLFQQNVESYVQMVKDSQVTSTGKVTSAALTSADANAAQALVAVSGTVKNASTPQEQQRLYRMRIDMVKEGDRWLVSKLEFVA